MLIFFGTRGITSQTQSGTFHCPACGAGAPYSRKNVRRFFTLFFIPLIPLNTVAEYVECHRCGGTFKPEVLGWNGITPQSPPPLPGSPPPLPGAAPLGLEAGHSGQAFAPSATTITAQGNGLALASMILGIVGMVMFILSCISLPCLVLSIVFGIIALVRVKKGGGVVQGKGQAIAGLICSGVGLLGLVLFTVYAVRSAREEAKKKESEGTQGISAKAQAVAHLRATGESKYYGNTDQARALAKAYFGKFIVRHIVTFIDSKGLAEAGQKYVVHCELREGTCAFMVYVPDYRKFTGDAKARLEKLAWDCGQEAAVQTGSLSKETEVCVALKGVLLFGAIMTGHVGDTAPAGTGTNEGELDRFFTAPELSAEDAVKVAPSPPNTSPAQSEN